jgi:hypothetical protein
MGIGPAHAQPWLKILQAARQGVNLTFARHSPCLADRLHALVESRRKTSTLAVIRTLGETKEVPRLNISSRVAGRN